jgi:hypothetical protein
VTVTDGNGCSATSAGTTVTVNPNPATPTIGAGGPLTFCAGGSVTLTSSSATGNVWSTGSTTPSIVVNTGGSYSVIVTDANGCSAASAVQSVVVNTSPVVVLEYAATSFCADGSTILPTIAVPFTPGAYFTAPTALSIDPNTGAITLLNTIVPNTYNIGLVSAGPCASSDWFELTIQNTSNNTTTISACDTYTWSENGTTYTQSGTYTSVIGCNTETVLNHLHPERHLHETGCSTETLVLTITPSTNNTTTISDTGATPRPWC